MRFLAQGNREQNVIQFLVLLYIMDRETETDRQTDRQTETENQTEWTNGTERQRERRY